MSKTETKEMEGEHDESECEFFLAEGATVFCCECGNLEMGDTTFYPKEKIDRLRSELQKAKEKEIRGDRMIVDLEHQKCVLKSDLSKAKELNGELVKIKNLVEELIEVAHFRNQWPTTTEAFESLIKNLIMTTEKDKAREPFKALCTKSVGEGYSIFFIEGEIYNSCDPEVYPPPDATATVALIDHQGDEHFMDWKWFHEHFEKLPQ